MPYAERVKKPLLSCCGASPGKEIQRLSTGSYTEPPMERESKPIPGDRPQMSNRYRTPSWTDSNTQRCWRMSIPIRLHITRLAIILAFKCTFCWHSDKYRARSIDDIVAELRWAIQRYRVDHLVLYDDCFSLKKERIYEFCSKVKLLCVELNWRLEWRCSLLVSSVDADLLDVMKGAGCSTIGFGFESYHPAVLKSMRKPSTPDQIKRAYQLTRAAGIEVMGFFLFGDTAETNESARTTLEYWKENCEGQVGLMFVQPYPGSEIYDRAVKLGVIRDRLEYIEKDMCNDNYFNVTSQMSDAEICSLRQDVLRARSRHMPAKIPMRICKDGTRENVFEVKIRCPFCQRIITYKNCLIEHRYTFGFDLTCRHCYMRYRVTSLIHYIGFKLLYRLVIKVKARVDIRNRMKARKI
jgi:anaerobic magnesium-protoporphyrin IX monomethyl ester cyclase